MVKRGHCPELHLLRAGKKQNPEEEGVICGPDGLSVTSKTETRGEASVNAQTDTECNIVIQSSVEGACVNTQTGTECNYVTQSKECVTTSRNQRGNRNKAMLLREKREWLKQKRTNA